MKMHAQFSLQNMVRGQSSLQRVVGSLTDTGLNPAQSTFSYSKRKFEKLMN